MYFFTFLYQPITRVNKAVKTLDIVQQKVGVKVKFCEGFLKTNFVQIINNLAIDFFWFI